MGFLHSRLYLPEPRHANQWESVPDSESGGALSESRVYGLDSEEEDLCEDL